MWVCVCSHSVVSNSLQPPWSVARQAPLSMGFSRQEYWGGLQCSPSGDLPDPGIKPVSPVSPALQVTSLPVESLRKPSLAHGLLVKKLRDLPRVTQPARVRERTYI